jgi:hypothetical protein
MDSSSSTDSDVRVKRPVNQLLADKTTPARCSSCIVDLKQEKAKTNACVCTILPFLCEETLLMSVLTSQPSRIEFASPITELSS